MSVASEFDIQRQLITNAYNKLDDLGIDSTGVDKNIDNIASLLDTIYQDYPKVQGQGTEVTLDGTKAGKLGLDIKGNSTQDGTPAPDNEVHILSVGDDIQLFNKNSNFYKRFPSSTYTVSGNNIHFKSITTNANEFFWVNIPVTIGKDITISYGNIQETVENQNNKMQFFFSSTEITTYSSNWSLTDISKTDKYITATATAQYLVLIFRTGNNQEYTISNVKVQQGSIVSPYSPYNMGSISEKIVNKNWLDINKCIMGANNTPVNSNVSFSTKTNRACTKYDVNPILCKPSTSYIVAFNTFYFSVAQLDINNKVLSDSGWKSANYTFTTNANARKIVMNFKKSDDSNFTIEEFKNAMIQVELGSTATTYTAHQEQTYIIPVQQPMRSIGDVRDEFIENKERHNIYRYIFTGNENLQLRDYGNNTVNSQIALFSFNFPFIYDVSKTPITMCNSFISLGKVGGWSVMRNENVGLALYSSNDQICYINTTVASTVANFKAYLAEKYASGNPVYIDYVLATPQDLPCTSEQISILENLPKSYNKQTNIYSLDVTPAYIEAKALKG